jgi:hypothetical protein
MIRDSQIPEHAGAGANHRFDMTAAVIIRHRETESQVRP